MRFSTASVALSIVVQMLGATPTYAHSTCRAYAHAYAVEEISSTDALHKLRVCIRKDLSSIQAKRGHSAGAKPAETNPLTCREFAAKYAFVPSDLSPKELSYFEACVDSYLASMTR